MAKNRQQLIDGLTRLTEAHMGPEGSPMHNALAYIKEFIRMAREHMTPEDQAAAEAFLAGRGDDLPDIPTKVALTPLMPAGAQWKLMKVFHAFALRGLPARPVDLAKILKKTPKNVDSILRGLRKKALVTKHTDSGPWLFTEAATALMKKEAALDQLLGTVGFEPELPWPKEPVTPPQPPAAEPAMAMTFRTPGGPKAVRIVGRADVEEPNTPGKGPQITVLRPRDQKVRIEATCPIGFTLDVPPAPGANPVEGLDPDFDPGPDDGLALG